MGFLDRAKKLAEQAKGMAEDAVADVRAKSADTSTTSTSAPSTSTPTASSSGPAEFGTPYVPGMLGRPGWREQGLTDPAAVLPIAERDRVGVPRSTKSQVVEEPYGMGRRWTSGGKTAALFYRLYPEHQTWQPPAPAAPLPEVPGATAATLPDGRSLVFLAEDATPVILETGGLDDASRAALARAVVDQLSS